MAKFTIFFKDKAIQSYIYDSGVIRIGRDSSNDLVIDNLTVAPVHALVNIDGDNCRIKQLSDRHPLIINHEKVEETFLENNNVISIGKYSIVFNTTESITPKEKPFSSNNKDVESLNLQLEDKVNIPDGNLQIMDGEHIGRILPLKKSMTRLGHAGSGVIIISKRKDGYFMSSLETHMNILINQQPLADKTIQLKTNDIITINNISMQFFLEQ